MNYYGAAELARSFRTVRTNTLQVADDILEAKYAFAPAPDSRTVAQTLVHIAISTRLALAIHAEQKLSTLEGFDFFKFLGGMQAEEAIPRTKAEIRALLVAEGDRFASFLEGLNDAFLAEPVTYPAGMQPPSKSRFEMLLSPKEHEMHHRAQLMVIQRILGITPHLTRQMMAQAAEMQRA